MVQHGPTYVRVAEQTGCIDRDLLYMDSLCVSILNLMNCMVNCNYFQKVILCCLELPGRGSLNSQKRYRKGPVWYGFLVGEIGKVHRCRALRLCTDRRVHRGSTGIGKGKVHRCTGTEALYRLYGL